MRQPDVTVLCRLCHLPAAHALKPADAASLLETALTDTAVCSVADAVCAICELLPGAQHITPDKLQELLKAVLPQHGSSTLNHIFSLPAAKDLARPVLASSSQQVLPAHQDKRSAPASSSRSSSPASSGRLGRALSSSSSSNSSSPVSRRSRSSTASSDCSSTTGGAGGGRRGLAARLCRDLSEAALLQPDSLEELLLPC